jgi:hypothetical protein
MQPPPNHDISQDSFTLIDLYMLLHVLEVKIFSYNAVRGDLEIVKFNYKQWNN